MRVDLFPRRGAVAFLLLVLGAACGRSGPSGPPPSPQPIPALKLAVLAASGGHLSYCDPDLYPVGHGTPLQNARRRFPTIQADAVAFQAILQHEHLTDRQPFTDDQLVAINEDYKQIQAIQFRPSGSGYRFTVLVTNAASPPGNDSVTGTVSSAGTVTIERRGPGQPIACPICLAAGVLISTPLGPSPVQDLAVGMPVWTTDRRGRRIPGIVLETGTMVAPIGHAIVRLTLADGRTVVASPGHPTADGRTVGALRPGDRLDGSRVVRAVLVPYAGSTFDILPSGPTGTYFGDGVLLGSTLSVGPRALRVG